MNDCLSKIESYWLGLMAVFGAFANYLIIMALQYINLVLSSLLNNLFPLFVVLIAGIMIQETLSLKQVSFIGGSFVGVVFMSLTSIKVAKNTTSS